MTSSSSEAFYLIGNSRQQRMLRSALQLRHGAWPALLISIMLAFKAPLRGRSLRNCIQLTVRLRS